MITSLEFKNAVATPTPSNHVFVVDVSGSMYSSLSSIRQHLKNNLAMLVKPADTVSVLYFSSKGEYGVVFAGEPINGVKDLSKIHQAIDKYLKPIGLTGFVEPLQLAFETVQGIGNNNLNSLIFMTDGYDNQWTESQILAKADQIKNVFDTATIIEYGYYCNRPLLEKMASTLNALHLFAEGYTQLEEELDKSLSASNSKRIKITVPKYTTDVVYNDGGRLAVYQVQDYDANDEGDVAYIPEHVSKVWAVNRQTNAPETKDVELLYVSLYVAVLDMNPDLAWDVLKLLGDVHLIKKYSNCFTKQDYSEIRTSIEQAVLDPEARFVDGVDYNLVPREDAYTVVDLLNDLADNGAKLITSSSYFSYSRIGKGRTQREDNTVNDIADQIAQATTKEERKALTQKLVDANEWTPEFVKESEEPVEFQALVFNESRPNISVRTMVKGTIDVPEVIRKDYPTLPPVLSSHIWRNYTIVKDGIINMKSLPVIIHVDLAEQLRDNEVELFEIDYLSETEFHISGLRAYVIDLLSVPVVNRQMVKDISGEAFFNVHIELQRQKAHQKVFKYYREELIGKVNALGLAAAYGNTAAEYLSGKGIRDYGFSPLTDSVESTDFYYSRELNVKIASLSSLPSVAAVLKKVADKKKLNVADGLMLEAIKQYDDFIKSPVITGAKTKDSLIANWIKEETQASIDEVRRIQRTLSKLMYGIVAGHGWFSDLDFENPTLQVINNGTEYTVTAVLETKEIKI